MRKIVSFVIGTLVAGSRTPTASKKAILPWRATRTTAPGMIFLSMSALSESVMRWRRSDERPTCSGLAGARLWAPTAVAVITHRNTASSSVFALMPSLLLVEVQRHERNRPGPPRYQHLRRPSSEPGELQV